MNSKMQFLPIKINKYLLFAILILALLGLGDAIFLTVKHYTGTINCAVWSGCQEVLISSYSTLFGIPVALLGVAYYLFILFSALAYWQSAKNIFANVLTFIPSLGFLFSLYLVYLQLVMIKYICIYCMLSALSSTLIFILSLIIFRQYKKSLSTITPAVE